MSGQKFPSLDQKEQTHHGGYFFPLKRYLTTLSDLYPSVAVHWHEEAELTMVTKGRCTYQIQFETYEAREGDILFVPPASLHSISIFPGEIFESETYVFHMNFLGAGTTDICTVRYFTPLLKQELHLPELIGKDHPVYDGLFQVFREMDPAYENMAPGYELVMKSLLLRALALLLPYGTEEASVPHLQEEHWFKLRMVVEYIGEHYAEDLTIPQLAKLCYFSEYHFMRFFKKYMGMSCLEYIKTLRLEKAAGLLGRGDTSVLDASLSSGFSNLSYFYREFKKKYGMTPKQFIEAMPKGGLEPHKFQ